MKSKKSLLENLPDSYKKQIKRFSSEGLQIMFQNRAKALEYAKKTIEKFSPEDLNEEYVGKVADGMQILARIVLEERGILSKN